MHLTRRDFLKASSAVAAALGYGGLLAPEAEGVPGGPPVVWLEAQACSGCSVSLLNSISIMGVDDLLLRTLDVKFHPTIMAAAGDTAVAAAKATRNKPGYILVVEGSIPTNQSCCALWPGTSALKGVKDFAKNALACIAVGTCASFGGVVAGKPNPTRARSLGAVVGSNKVINIPGCPVHPDWLVGTIAYILKNQKAPPLDRFRRPTEYFGATVHNLCPHLDQFNSWFGRRLSHSKNMACFTCHSAGNRDVKGPRTLSDGGCLYALGCKGMVTGCDCSVRGWNAGVPGGKGVNWCVGANSPCIGCTEPGFPDVMSPFNALSGPGVDDDEGDDD